MNKSNILKLIKWYQKNKRDLPWRHTKDPYQIWISEIMLQQTQVDYVKKYYYQFIKALPDITHLAHVKEDDLLKLWQGLGYYNRARNLKKCAEELVNKYDGVFPDLEETLLSLPGLGSYTVGAILSIAFLKNTPAIDGNVKRVLGRVYMEKREISGKVMKYYQEILKKLMKDVPSDDFTQGLIELGALICIPKGTPKCQECPLKSGCMAYQNSKIMEYPFKKKKKEKKQEKKTVMIIRYKNLIVIRKRTKESLLAHLYELPNIDGFLEAKEIEQKFSSDDKVEYLGEFKHVFTHVVWNLKIYEIKLKKKDSKYSYVTMNDVYQKYSLPTVFVKALKKSQKEL